MKDTGKQSKRTTALVLFLTLASLALLQTGCKSKGGSSAANTLHYLQITPATATIGAGETQKFSVTSVYADGHSEAVTSGITWSSSNTAVATIDASGEATGIAATGTATATITATVGNLSGTTSLTVTAASVVLQSVAVTPATASVAAGFTQQFTAKGTYSDGTTVTLTNNVTWQSDTTSVATIDTTGLATGVTTGTAKITATFGGVTSPAATFMITDAVLQSVAITPTTASVAVGLAKQFTAKGNYSDGTTITLTNNVVWQSDATGIATVTNSGLATGKSIGTANITATFGGIASPAATLTVTAAVLQSVAVTPATASIAAGLTKQYTAKGTYSDGTTIKIANNISWQSNSPSIADIDSSTGLATGKTPGTAYITATFDGVVSPAANLTVTTAELWTIAVTPATASIAKGLTNQFTAKGTYSDGTTATITHLVTWSSDTTGVTIDTTGLATGVNEVSANIYAKSDPITSPAAKLTVTAAVLQSIAVTPATASVAAGLDKQFTAKGTYSDGTTMTLMNAAWTSDAPDVATIDVNSGLATGVSSGTATITATFGGITSPGATLTVTAALLQSVTVTPATASVAAGLDKQFTAKGTYSDGTTVMLTNEAVWKSDATDVATVDNAGLATCVKKGSARITAAFGGFTSPAALLTVTDAVLQAIAVTPAAASVAAGLTQQFTAKGTYSDGTIVTLTNLVTWASDNTTGAAIIDSSGLATGKTAGTTHITATYDGVSSLPTAATLTVTPATLTGVVISPSSASLAAGLTKQFTAIGTYTDSSTAVLTDGVTWKSSSPAVATIDSSGLATGVAVGSTNITAAYGGFTSPAATLTVAITSLSFPSDLPYTGGSVDTTASYYKITGLTPGNGYSISLTNLTYNADLYVYSDTYYSTWLCKSWELSNNNESCAAIANTSGELYVKIDGYYTQSGATFTLNATAAVAPDLTGATLNFGSDLPYAGTLYSTTTASYFKINGLTPGAGYTVSLTNMHSDADLHVYRDRYFNNLLCESINNLTTDDFCVATADASGQLYVEVDGVLSTPNTTYTLNAITAGAPTLNDIMIFGSIDLPYDGNVDTTARYYKVTGLTAGAGYTTTLTGLTDDADLYVYSDPYFGAQLCSSWNSGTSNEACVATANATGEFYVLVDGYFVKGATASFTLGISPY